MYKVWSKVRDHKTLEVVAEVLEFEHEDRLTAEAWIEGVNAIGANGMPVAPRPQRLGYVPTGAIVSMEMEYPHHAAARKCLQDAIEYHHDCRNHRTLKMLTK